MKKDERKMLVIIDELTNLENELRQIDWGDDKEIVAQKFTNSLNRKLISKKYDQYKEEYQAIKCSITVWMSGKATGDEVANQVRALYKKMLKKLINSK